MSSAECFRELINDRLTAAAEEIFGVFQQTVVVYEKEICRQRRLLDLILKPGIKIHRTELPQQYVCKEEEALDDQELCNRERSSSLDEPEPPQIKEEQEELCTSLEGEQLVLKQETETFMMTPTCEDYSDYSEYQTLDLSPDETAAEKEHVVSMSVKGSVEPEPNRDDQFLAYNFHVAESQDHKGGKQAHSRSTRNAKPKPPKRRHENKNHSDNVYNPNMSNIQLDTHTGKKVWKCDTCGKAFMYNSQLNKHQRVHTGEKPYPCNTCEKRFFDLGTLKAHMRIHTGEKPYPCNTCEKRFFNLSAAKVHMRVHTGEKPYPCNTCEKRFSKLSVLKVHMRVHTGEKPYPCNTCEKRFSKMFALKEHMRIHTGEKPYKCKTCRKDFRRRHHLKFHMRTHTVG